MKIPPNSNIVGGILKSFQYSLNLPVTKGSMLSKKPGKPGFFIASFALQSSCCPLDFFQCPGGAQSQHAHENRRHDRQVSHRQVDVIACRFQPELARRLHDVVPGECSIAHPAHEWTPARLECSSASFATRLPAVRMHRQNWPTPGRNSGWLFECRRTAPHPVRPFDGSFPLLPHPAMLPKSRSGPACF